MIWLNKWLIFLSIYYIYIISVKTRRTSHKSAASLKDDSKVPNQKTKIATKRKHDEIVKKSTENIKSTEVEQTSPVVRRSAREQPPSSKYPLKVHTPVKQSSLSPPTKVVIPKLSMSKSKAKKPPAKKIKSKEVANEEKIEEINTSTSNDSARSATTVAAKNVEVVEDSSFDGSVRKSSRSPKKSAKLLDFEETEELLKVSVSPTVIGKRRATAAMRSALVKPVEIQKNQVQANSKIETNKPVKSTNKPEVSTLKVQQDTTDTNSSRRSSRKQPPTSKYPLKRKAESANFETSTPSEGSQAKQPKIKPKVSTTNSSFTSNTSTESSSRGLRPKRIFKIMTTMLKTDYEDLINRLGGEMSTARDANILIANKITRTAKFLCAVSRGITILTEMWLEESSNAHLFLGIFFHILP